MNHYHKTTTAGFFALGGPVLGVGGAQEKQGRTLQVCLSSSPNTHSTHVFICPCVSVTTCSGVVFLLSNNFSQVGSRSWQTDCRRSWTVYSRILCRSRSWMCQCRGSWWKSCSLSLAGVRRQHGWTCIFPVPQILEQSVEVVRALSDPGEDC